MESYINPGNQGIRLSESPRKSPKIQNPLTSPARSVRPQMQQTESINSQPDFAMRATDFFEDSSDDEEPNLHDTGTAAMDVDLLERRGATTKRRHTGPKIEPFVSQCENNQRRTGLDHVGYHPLEETQLADTASSFNGPFDALLPSGNHNSALQHPQGSQFPSGRTPRHSVYIERTENRQSALPSTTVDQTIGAYAVAHEITLQALMRDENALDRSLQSLALAPLQAGDRRSLLPQSLDPRSPRAFSSPATVKKAVHILPPTIDTSIPRRSIPDDVVRTPYPYSPDMVRHKEFGALDLAAAAASTPRPTTERVLLLSIRQRNSNTRRRITSLTIPAMNDSTAVRSGSLGPKERHFNAIVFDDAEFFSQIRRSYHELSGSIRFFSARSLRRIAVTGLATKAADIRYGWRSPQSQISKGHTFSEEQILQHYRKPALGRSRYAFVQWAHRLTASTPARTPQGNDSEGEKAGRDLPGQLDEVEGLEFVESWSPMRIVIALGLVLLLSIAAALLWTFLGLSTASATSPQGGFRDSGDRLTTAFVMGICILLIGLSGIAGWLGVSWFLM